MKLTEAMKFLSPAIEKTNKILPVLSHIRITQGYAVASNGMLAMAAPIALPLDCTPNGLLLEKAVERFGDDFSATQQANGSLYFKANGFQVTVPCTTDYFPMPDFSGEPVLPGAGLLAALKRLLPFTTKTEDQPWRDGILLRGGKALATCGHTLAWVPVALPEGVEVVIPSDAARAMLEIGLEPEYLARSQDRLVVVYSEGRFLSYPLIHTPWPATANLVEHQPTQPVPEGFWKAIRDIQPFTLPGTNADTFYLLDGAVASDKAGIGAKADVPGVLGGWSCNYSAIRLIEKHAKKINFTSRFGSWEGDGICGKIALTKVS